MNTSSHPIPPAPPQSAAAHYGQPEISGPVIATDKQRLANYLLDRFAIFALFLVFIIITEEYYPVPEDTETLMGFLLILAYPAYLIICESIWQRTLGKLASKTKVVDVHGNKPGFWRIVGRTFARLIPFEVFSFLGGKYPIGWHDSLSGTLVVPVDYSPEQIRGIHPDELKKSKSNSGVAIVLLVIGIIAVIGILSSVVLASLTTAREKGKQATMNQSALSPDKGTYENSIVTTPEKDASAFFPIKPAVEVKKDLAIDGSDVTYDYIGYFATAKKIDYGFVRYAYSEPFPKDVDIEELLRGTVAGLGESFTDAKVVSSKYAIQNTQPVLTLKMTHSEGVVEGVSIFTNNNVYMFFVDYHPEDPVSVLSARKFLDSSLVVNKPGFIAN